MTRSETELWNFFNSGRYRAWSGNSSALIPNVTYEQETSGSSEESEETERKEDEERGCRAFLKPFLRPFIGVVVVFVLALGGGAVFGVVKWTQARAATDARRETEEGENRPSTARSSSESVRLVTETGPNTPGADTADVDLTPNGVVYSSQVNNPDYFNADT